MRPVDMTGVPGQLALAFRRLRRTPGFTLAAVLLLGIGVGLGIPCFNVINVELLKPAAASRDYPHVVVNDRAWLMLAREEIDAVRSNPPASFVELLGSGLHRTTAVIDGISLRTNVEGVAGPYFAEFPTVPLAGRLLTVDDERERRDVAVIGERLWRVGFGARPDAVGASFTLAGRRVTVVGVVGDAYNGAPMGRRHERRDAWVPATITPPTTLFGRLRADVAIGQANAELMGRRMPPSESGPRVLGVQRGLRLALSEMSDRMHSWMLLFLASGIAISLIAAGSFSLLLFARLLSGQADLSIRLALGATVRDLTRLLAFEACLLALAATTVAVWVGTLLSSVFVAQLNDASGMAIAPDLSPDWRLVAYTTLTTFGAAGMVVARLVWNLRALEALGSMVATSGVGTSTQRTAGETNRLVIAQTAVSTGLLLVAVMLSRTVLSGADPTTDLDIEHSAIAWLDQGALPDSPAEAAAAVHRAVDITAAAGGVIDAAAITLLPGMSTAWSTVWRGPSEGRTKVRQHYVTSAAFDALRHPILRGRTFTAAEDRAGAAVVVVSATAAERIWPGGDAVGRPLWLGDGDRKVGPLDIVGVVTDIPPKLIGRGPASDIYLPIAYRRAWYPIGIVARASDDGAHLAERLRDTYRTELPETGFLHVRSMRQELDDRLSAATFSARTYGVLGLLVFIVAMGGLYGLSAHLATLRRREIGIRRALGATTTMLCRMLHHEHSRMLALGVGIGCLGGLFFASLLLRYFPTLQMWDPASLIVVAGTLYVAGLAGAIAPFVRTMRAATVSLRD